MLKYFTFCPSALPCPFFAAPARDHGFESAQKRPPHTAVPENEYFIFRSCIIFLCRPYPSDGRLRVRPCGLLRSVLGPSRANALPPLSPSVTAGRRPRLRGWRFEDGPKGPAEPEPQPGEAEVGARKKMISEAATWAAPRSGKASPAEFEGRALRGWRFANVVCEPKPRPGGLRERFSATRGVRIEDSPPRTRGRPKDGHGRKARPGRRY